MSRINQKTTYMKNSIISFSALAFLCISLFFSSCKKKDTIVEETCSDGIQNQDEAGVDCGGPCSPCKQSVCDGNGSSTYLPLAVNNSWAYFMDNSATTDYTTIQTITGTKVLSNSKTYFVMDYGSKQDYFRVETNGDIYAWKTNSFNDLGAAESLFLPGNPVVGTTWKDPYFIPDSSVVKATDAVLISSNGCSYMGLLKIDTYSYGNYYETLYFKKGLGKVQQASTGILGYKKYITAIDLK
jgi:hypothetical protein